MSSFLRIRGCSAWEVRSRHFAGTRTRVAENHLYYGPAVLSWSDKGLLSDRVRQKRESVKPPRLEKLLFRIDEYFYDSEFIKRHYLIFA